MGRCSREGQHGLHFVCDLEPVPRPVKCAAPLWKHLVADEAVDVGVVGYPHHNPSALAEELTHREIHEVVRIECLVRGTTLYAHGRPRRQGPQPSDVAVEVPSARGNHVPLAVQAMNLLNVDRTPTNAPHALRGARESVIPGGRIAVVNAAGVVFGTGVVSGGGGGGGGSGDGGGDDGAYVQYIVHVVRNELHQRLASRRPKSPSCQARPHGSLALRWRAHSSRWGLWGE
eukprot:1327089-Amorphochlora_amoeboformis.AAC.1